jgi:hypothetical protein
MSDTVSKKYHQAYVAKLEEELSEYKEEKEESHLKDRGKTNEINILTKENSALRSRLAEAERLLDRAAHGGELTPSGGVAIVLEISGFLAKNVGSFAAPTSPDHTLIPLTYLKKLGTASGWDVDEEIYQWAKTVFGGDL